MSKFKKLLRPRNLIIFFLVLSIIVVSFGALVTRAGLNLKFDRLNHGEVLIINDNYIAVGNQSGPCKQIVNNSGVDYFIPTNSADEWNLFVAAAPRLNVTASPCPCGHQSDCPSGYYCYDFEAYCKAFENHSCSGYDKADCLALSCGTWDVTQQGYCVSGTCTPLCAGKSCGPNYCGGTCGACGGGYVCSMAGTCVSTSSCGNGACDNGETCSTCSTDCGACCSANSDCASGQYCSGVNAYCTGLESHGCLDGYGKEDCISIGCEWYVDVMGTCTW